MSHGNVGEHWPWFLKREKVWLNYFCSYVTITIHSMMNALNRATFQSSPTIISGVESYLDKLINDNFNSPKIYFRSYTSRLLTLHRLSINVSVTCLLCELIGYRWPRTHLAVFVFSLTILDKTLAETPKFNQKTRSFDTLTGAATRETRVQAFHLSPWFVQRTAPAAIVRLAPCD